ncbi:MAG: hypothetical protein JWM16_1628 [Verrucomicrobiales bacterium]|nr:hypothetical protein [Verrucomicrobiales bacterium]
MKHLLDVNVLLIIHGHKLATFDEHIVHAAVELVLPPTLP